MGIFQSSKEFMLMTSAVLLIFLVSRWYVRPFELVCTHNLYDIKLFSLLPTSFPYFIVPQHEERLNWLLFILFLIPLIEPSPLWHRRLELVCSLLLKVLANIVVQGGSILSQTLYPLACQNSNMPFMKFMGNSADWLYVVSSNLMGILGCLI